MQERWVQIWGQAHSSLSLFYYPSSEKTYRFVINSALSGNALRLRLSNEFSDDDVYVGSVTLARCDGDGRLSGEIKDITVNGSKAFILKKGERLLSDEIPFSCAVGKHIAVSIFVKKGSLKSGNLLNNVKLLTVRGDVTRKTEIINERRKRDTVIDVAGKILNLFLHKPLPLIESVEVLNTEGASSITVLGDSLCQQGFWTNRFEERIREEYPGRYSVINKSIMGNRILRDYSRRFPLRGLFGYSAKNRLCKDVLNFKDTEYVIVAVGTNDLVQYGTIAAPKSEKPTAEELLGGLTEITDEIKRNGKKPIVFNVAMFGECIDSRPEKEKMAKEYNRLLENNKDSFYCLFNQCDKVINPEKPNCTKKEYLGKDNLHYNKLGGDTVADSIDLSIFE